MGTGESLEECSHGDDEKVHAEVGEWMKRRAAELREKKWLELGPKALSPVVANIGDDSAERFPGCVHASPLLVLLLGALPAP